MEITELFTTYNNGTTYYWVKYSDGTQQEIKESVYYAYQKRLNR